MAVDIEIGDAVGSGLLLIRRRPLAVASWGLLVGLFIFLALLLVLPAFHVFAIRMQQGAGDWRDGLGMLAQLQVAGLVINLVGFIMRAVIIGAVFRAVLKPQEGAFAYMRLGVSELFLALLIFAWGIVLFFIIILVGGPFVLSVVWLATAHEVVGAVLVGLVGVLLVATLAIWLGLRLALLGPMIVAGNGFPLTEAWAITRGRAGSLALIAVVIVVVLFALEVLVFGVAGALGLGILSRFPHGIEGLKSFFVRGSMGDLMAGLAPLLVLGWLIWSWFIGAATAITFAPWAAAYRQLVPAQPAGAPAS